MDCAGFAPTKPKRQNLNLVGLTAPPTILTVFRVHTTLATVGFEPTPS